MLGQEAEPGRSLWPFRCKCLLYQSWCPSQPPVPSYRGEDTQQQGATLVLEKTHSS